MFAQLVPLHNLGLGCELTGDQRQIIVGRHPGCQIVEDNSFVSLHHLRVYRGASGFSRRYKRYSVKQRKQIDFQRAGGDVLPGDLSLLEVSDEGEHDIEDDAVEVIEYRIERTFVTVGPFAPVPEGLKSSASV